MEKLVVGGTEWDLSPLEKGKSFEEKRKDWQDATDKFISKWKNNDEYLESAEKLKEALDDYEKWNCFFGTEADEAYYYWLKTQQDQNDPELKAKFNKIEEFSKRIGNSMKFFILKLSKISLDMQKEFLENDLLKDYKHFLERVFISAKYRLSESEEKIMSLKSKSAYSSWVKMISGFLSKEEREILDEEEKLVLKNFNEIMSLLSSKKKIIRDKAAEMFNEILDKYKELAENELNAILEDKKVNDELRGYSRPDESRHISDDLDSKTVDTIVEVIKKRFDLAKKYYELKAKLLGVEKLGYHERNVEYGKVDKKYPYEEAINLVYKVFNKLDKRFGEILKDFVENSKIDVYPRKGKYVGAFCTRQLKTQSSYVLLNHESKLDDVRCVAHEIGHAINNELMKEKQNSLNVGNYLSISEVASKFMESCVFHELINNADEELKLTLILQKLNNDISSISRQVACDLFQRELHKTFREKGYLSFKEIGEIFKKHMSSYMGKFVEQSKGSENWWIYIPHFRRYFYSYQYSSGLLISKALQRKIRENPEFIEKVKEFLSAGTSDSPKNIFLKMGIDITSENFWNSGLDEVEDLLNEAENLASKLGKIK